MKKWKYTNHVFQYSQICCSCHCARKYTVLCTCVRFQWCVKNPGYTLSFFLWSVFTAVAAILYECRLGCLESEVPQETQDYIAALHLMFSSFKTTMYAGAIPKWLRSIIPKPWEEFCDSWDGLFKFSKCFTASNLWRKDTLTILVSILVSSTVCIDKHI